MKARAIYPRHESAPLEARVPRYRHARGRLALVLAVACVAATGAPSLGAAGTAPRASGQAVVERAVAAAAGSSDRLVAQDFDLPGAPYAAAQCAAPPGPEVRDGGPWGNYLRVATSAAPSENAVAFDRIAAVPDDTIVADFDLRISPEPPGRADGVGFALLDAGVFGATGPVCPAGEAEEPSYAASLGIGLDVYRNVGAGDIGNGVIRAQFSNSVSVHFDGELLWQADAAPVVDLAGGQWLHVRVVVEPDDGASRVSVTLTPFGGRPVAVVSAFRVEGMVARDARAAFSARSGGEGAEFDIDNVRVVALAPGESAFSFESPWAFADEDGGRAELSVTRVGNTGSRARVRYATADATAAAGNDYRGRSGVVEFAPGETTRRVRVKLRDDAEREEDESFRVRLEPLSRRAALAGPSSAEVLVYDDESARLRGRWSAPLWWPVVPVHAALLPTGRLLFWDRFGSCWRWDPAAGAVDRPAQPPFNVFCAGHTLLGDGRLLAAGGHLHDGAPEHDGVGIPHAAAYDPFEDAWAQLPDMEGGRWYPTTTTLAGGDALVVSGSVDESENPNLLPQIWRAADDAWESLDSARDREPYGVDLYPRLFLARDGRVFKAGPDRQSWYLDLEGQGAWSRGPLGVYDRPRTYGPAAMYAPGKIIVAGGGNPPTETAEVIDLDAAAPAWRAVAPMAFARRHANLTLLPDGTALATGGTSGPGTNNQRTPVLAAELWDPATEAWQLLPSQRVPRLYHSVALLLPDGRVLSGGGGQGAQATGNYNNAELYSPAYLFKGPRPTIVAAPEEVRHGERFFVRTGAAEAVARVTLVRLPSVTHAFDENQRFLELEFSREGRGVAVTAPALATECPDGHYMLFVLSAEGVPSVARIVSVRS